MAALLELVSASVPLKRRGKAHWGICPFHSPDKTGSFKVEHRHGKERFHCFGCAASGDAADWLMRTRRVGYVEAKRILGEERARPDPAILAAQRERTWREHSINSYRDHAPECLCPDWLLETPRCPSGWQPPPRVDPRTYSAEELDRIFAGIWGAAT